jgi:hypothetical protein
MRLTQYSVGSIRAYVWAGVFLVILVVYLLTHR